MDYSWVSLIWPILWIIKDHFDWTDQLMWKSGNHVLSSAEFLTQLGRAGHIAKPSSRAPSCKTKSVYACLSYKSAVTYNLNECIKRQKHVLVSVRMIWQLNMHTKGAGTTVEKQQSNQRDDLSNVPTAVFPLNWGGGDTGNLLKCLYSSTWPSLPTCRHQSL